MNKIISALAIAAAIAAATSSCSPGKSAKDDEVMSDTITEVQTTVITDSVASDTTQIQPTATEAN